MLRLLVVILMAALPVHADPTAALDRITTGYGAFARATADLDHAATQGCMGLEPAFQTAWDAWMAVAHIHMGPAEESGRAMAIAFWPDPKGSGARAQRLLLTGDPAALAPARFAGQSVAARGLPALERLLYPAAALPGDPCPLIRATTADLARTAAELQAGWPAFAALLSNPGSPGNTRYLTRQEAAQALVTQLATGLDYNAGQRIGRPLGTLARPFPDRAEARASGRSLRNIDLSLQALRHMAQDLAPEAEASLDAIDRALLLARGLRDPILAGITESQGWLKLEILQSAILAARAQVLAEIAPALGAGLGFNALDGD